MPEILTVLVSVKVRPTQPSPQAFSLAPLSAWSLGKSVRVSLGDVTAHGRVQDWPSRERLGTRRRPTDSPPCLCKGKWNVTFICIPRFWRKWQPAFFGGKLHEKQPRMKRIQESEKKNIIVSVSVREKTLLELSSHLLILGGKSG